MRGLLQRWTKSSIIPASRKRSAWRNKRPIWSLGSMKDSGCDVYFTKDICWIAQKQRERTWRDSQRWSVLRGNQTFKNCRRRKQTRWNSVRCHKQRSNEQRRQECRLDLESLTLRRETRWTEMNRRCPSEFPQAPWHPQLKRKSCTRLRDTRLLQREQRMNRIWGNSSQKQTKPRQELSSTQQSWSERRIKHCQHFLSMRLMTDQRAQRQHRVPRKHSVSVWHSWRFSDTMWWCYTQTKKRVLVQLLKTVQSRRFERTSVRPWSKNQSSEPEQDWEREIKWQSHLKILCEKKKNCQTTAFCWLGRFVTLREISTEFQMKNDGRSALLRVSGKAHTSQLPYGERVMYEHTAVPTDNPNQRWGHGIWIGEAPMTDECTILTENGIQKAKSLHRVTFKETFLISELERAREYFLGTTWQRIWSQRLRRTRAQVHLDNGVCVWRSRSWWGLEEHLDAAAVPDRDLTRKHVGCDREGHWLTRKKARVRERSEQEFDRLLKWPRSSNSQQSWCSRKPSPSPSFSPTAPMQEPTQNS